MAEEKPRVRRSRATEIQLYKPPKLRAPGEQRSIPKQVIGVVEERLLKSVPDRTKKHFPIDERGDRWNPRSKTSHRSKHFESSHQIQKCPAEGHELIKIEWEKRVVGKCDVAHLETLATNPDVTIVSSEGRGCNTNFELLEHMSPYFACVHQDKWQETKRKVIKTMISKDSLEPVVNFFGSGEIVLTHANVEAILDVAEYFQVECLLEACRNYILSRMDVLHGKALHLGMKYVAMASVGEQAIDYLCENISKMSEEISAMGVESLVMILSQDDLKVKSEDEVCNIVLKWLKGERKEESIRKIVECIRLPHLSRDSFDRLCTAVEKIADLPNFDLVKSADFMNLPDVQLTRRSFYNRHFHVIWKRTTIYSRCFEQEEEYDFEIACLVCNDQQSVSEYSLNSFKDFREHLTSFEFIPIMNSLFMVTHSKPSNYILIFQMQNGNRWVQRIKYKRNVELPDFAASVLGTKLHLCIFDGFKNPLKMLQIQPTAFANVQTVDYEVPFKMHFSPPKMLFHDDFAIYMSETSIKICDRVTNDIATIPLNLEDSNGMIKRKFTDILRLENYLYAYEEQQAEFVSGNKESKFSRFYVINLKTKETESVIKIPLTSAVPIRSKTAADKSFVAPKIFIIGSRLVVGSLCSGETNRHMFFEYDPDKEAFDLMADIPSVEQQGSYSISKKLVKVLPNHFHRCKHETLLQEYCNSLREPAEMPKLLRLSFFL